MQHACQHGYGKPQLPAKAWAPQHLNEVMPCQVFQQTNASPANMISAQQRKREAAAAAAEAEFSRTLESVLRHMSCSSANCSGGSASGGYNNSAGASSALQNDPEAAADAEALTDADAALEFAARAADVRRAALHSAWSSEVFDVIQGRLTAAIQERPAAAIEARLRAASDAYVEATNAKARIKGGGVFGDVIIPEDYDPLAHR